MPFDAIITIIVVVTALTLFATEVYSVDVVAMGAMVTLVLTGVISPEEGVRGFANSATVTIASLFVISDALMRTGFIRKLAPYFARLLDMGHGKAIAGMGALIGGISAFVNNTPIVATFIPVTSSAADRNGFPPSRYLIPLSYVAIFGGTCTLIGTSTNLLVSGIAQDAGEPGFTMFLMAPLGLIFAITGTIYLTIFGRKLIPEREFGEAFEKSVQLHDFEMDLRVNEIPKQQKNDINSLLELDENDGSIEVLQVRRDDQDTKKPDSDFQLKKNDYLHLRGDLKRIRKLIEKECLTAAKQMEEEVHTKKKDQLMQVVLLPHSSLNDQKLGENRFFENYEAEIIAMRSRGHDRYTDLEDVVLRSGDVLLLQTSEHGMQRIREAEANQEAPFLSLYEEKLGQFHPLRMWIVVGLLATIITLATLGIVPIMIATLSGAVILNFLRMTNPKDSYYAIDWKVIFLIAGALSMGKAIETSGIASAIGGFLVDGVGSVSGPVAIIAALYLFTLILTELMSNNAAAAVMAPIALATASAINVDATPLLLAVAFAGSASFITPVGYQTNTMVYSAGNYRFTDFARIGLPLSLTFWILASFLIPVLYPL